MTVATQEPGRLTRGGQPATLQPGLLIRRRLLNRLLTADGPVLIVAGPPGSGKTTLLAQYAQRDERALVWLSIQEADNDPAFLREQLTTVLGEISPACADLVPALLGDGTDILPGTRRRSRNPTVPFSLVLDNVDVLASPAARDVLAALSALMPMDCRLLMGARRTPHIGIGGLRALGRVTEIGATDLAFTAPEAGALVQAAGVELRGSDLETLMRSTEGWATGLYLAALSARSKTSGVRGFSGADPLISDYIWDESLSDLSESTIDFLIRSSVLDRISGATCDSLLRTRGSGVLLRELHRSNVFLVSLDRYECSYRYHHLFGQALKAELHRRDPSLEKELHRRASTWYQSQGNAAAAITHAARARDIRKASNLIWAEISPASNPPQHVLEDWLSTFSEHEAAAEPLLALSWAWLCTQRKDGDSTDRWVSAAERGYHPGRLPGGPTTLAAATSLLRAMLGREGIACMTRDASQAWDLDADHGPWRGVAQYYQGVGRYLQGDRDNGRKALEECERRCRWSVPLTHAECLGQLALISLEDGDGARWRELSGRVSRAEDDLISDAPPIVHAVSALFHAQEGDRARATTSLDQANSGTAREGHFSPWRAAQCRIVMARANLALSDGEWARRLLSDASLILRGISDAIVLIEWRDKLRTALTGYPVALHNGGKALTAAELRVLHLLPTHLSFPEIGSRLYVSRNTVKTQAISVYRKLGVGSRADAVGRAQALGLLENMR